VFSGGWTLEAAEAMWSDTTDIVEAEEINQVASPNILDCLTQLVDKSLVILDYSPLQPRYHLLDTIRQYALEKLRETGDEAEQRNQHLAYFTSLAKQASPHLRSKGMIGWLDRLEPDLDNLRTALEWSMAPQNRANKIEQGCRLPQTCCSSGGARLFNQTYRFAKKIVGCRNGYTWRPTAEGNRSLQRARHLHPLSFRS
jgi:hypothetical protein